VLQETDEVPVLRTLLLVVIGIALVVLGVVWPWAILARSPAQAPDPRVGSEPRVTDPQPRFLGGFPESRATDQVGEVARVPLQSTGGAVLEPNTPRAAPRLDRFEWADRKRRTVDLPLDIAERLWLAREAERREGGGVNEAATTPRGAP
jgi:hypothetical protein